MQRKAYATGVTTGIAALLAALLAGCSGGSQDHGPTDNANPGDTARATSAAQPGKYRTLPEACAAVQHDSLDDLLPGIREITDPEQRDRAYQGDATLTYDTDRKVGCRWKVESTGKTDHLLVDFERVVSYDSTVSDDSQAGQLYATRQTAADLPAPAPTTAAPTSSGAPSATSSPTGTASAPPPASSSASSSGSSPGSPGTAPVDLQPRVLDDLGDEAYIDDKLSSSGSTAEQRTVTVVFRTSNVIVTIQYDEQPTTVGMVPDSEEMQDRARKLAGALDDTLAG
ncbi:DUF3558 domain-containing protein [Streptomyces sp. NPDC086787]|uniref:DUF3558 domain-containing protein n=1 Tax=Streptomyces sp. NPDC086787 TaxID=3365759 RepID=UPI0037FB774A